MTIKDWNVPKIGGSGRFVEIVDNCMRYVAEMPATNKGGDEYELADAISDFGSTYDTNGNSEPVPCTARLYVDGEVVACEQFEIEA